MPDDSLRTRGHAMRRELLGATAADNLDRDLYTGDPVMGKLADLAEEIIFGALWTRDGIDIKTRSVVTLAADVAAGQTEALQLHVRYALRHGWTEDELVEVILHLTGYVGVPNVRRSLIAAKATFSQVRSEGQASSDL